MVWRAVPNFNGQTDIPERGVAYLVLSGREEHHLGKADDQPARFESWIQASLLQDALYPEEVLSGFDRSGLFGRDLPGIGCWRRLADGASPRILARTTTRQVAASLRPTK